MLELLQRDRVVEVAGRRRVDRDDRLAGEILPIGAGRLRADRLVELLRLPPGVFERVLGKRPRQAELVDDRQRVDPRHAAVAQHLDDHRLAVADVRREADHFDHDLVVRLHALGAGVADVHRVGEDLAVDLHHRHAGLLEIRADEAVGRPVDDVDDPPLDLPHAADLARQPHAHRVAVGGVAACTWRE